MGLIVEKGIKLESSIPSRRLVGDDFHWHNKVQVASEASIQSIEASTCGNPTRSPLGRWSSIFHTAFAVWIASHKESSWFLSSIFVTTFDEQHKKPGALSPSLFSFLSSSRLLILKGDTCTCTKNCMLSHHGVWNDCVSTSQPNVVGIVYAYAALSLPIATNRGAKGET